MIHLMQGDCVERMHGISDQSIDLTVTSPPYDDMRNYNGNNEQWCERVWEEVLKELYRVTKDGGVVVWIVGDATIKGSESTSSFKQAMFAVKCGFRLHDTMIWNKPSTPPTQRNRYQQKFEYMFVFTKGSPSAFNPLKEKSQTAGRIRKTHRSKTGNHELNEEGEYTTKDYKMIGNVWDINICSEKGIKHPAKFPLKLAEDHITTWSNKGDVVFDPFAGSGTTGVACVNSGRSFIGIELDQDYFNIANNRIEEVK
jgi:site-specific DNA-methyltransferase (adenine-specific)